MQLHRAPCQLGHQIAGTREDGAASILARKNGNIITALFLVQQESPDEQTLTLLIVTVADML